MSVIGVCIPWPNARVNTASITHKKWEGRKRWDDHRQYLRSLPEVLDRASGRRMIVAGDFNQQLPKSRSTPADVHEQLMSVVASRLTIATAGVGLRGRRCIDHIALSEDLAVQSLCVIDNTNGASKLSDHFGIVADVSADS